MTDLDTLLEELLGLDVAVPPAAPPAAPEGDGFDALTDAVSTAHVNQRYVALDTVTFNEDIYLQSAWGTAKTCCYVEALKALPTAKTALIVSCRKTLSDQHAKNLEGRAISYMAFKGDLDLIEHPMSIFQLESLGRIPLEAAFDVLVIDEPAALLAHAYQDGRNPKAAGGLTRLWQLVKSAGSVCVVDNDLPSELVKCFSELRPNAPRRVICNDAQPWKGSACELLMGHKPSQRAALMRRLKVQGERRAHHEGYEATVVPCHSLKFATALAKEIRGLFGEDSVRLYTSESSDFERAADCRDADTAWDDVLAVIYTPTITVGVSSSAQHFTECWAFFKASGNQQAAQSLQMLFRARSVRSFKLCVTGKPINCPQDPPELFQQVTGVKHRSQIPDELRSDRNGAVQANTAGDAGELAAYTNSNPSARAWLFNTIRLNRSSADFVGCVTRTLCAAGVEILDVEQPSSSAEERKAAKAATDAAKAERSELIAAELPAALAAVNEERGRDEPPPVMLTAAEKAGRRGAHLTGVFGIGDADACDINAEWVQHYEPLAHGYARYKARILGRELQADALATRSDREGSDLICAALSAAGADLTGGAVSLCADNKILVAACHALNANAARVYGDANARRRRKRPLDSAKALAGALAPCLREHFGGKLERCYENGNHHKPSGFKLTWPWEGGPAPVPEAIGIINIQEKLPPQIQQPQAQPAFSPDDVFE